jgi:L-glyceraldehyde 3-phosphate reductase
MDTAARPLGSSGLTVSRLALGSWRTFERMTPEAGEAVMRAARDAGITFLDDARYDDEAGTAPLRTGYSEVRFGELFRAAGWERAETVVANKLWWEFWPEQNAAAELDASLERMQFDYVDVIYANPPINGITIDTLVDEAAGRADQLLECSRVATRAGAPQPCAAQLPCSLVNRAWVEDAEMKRALDACGAPVVASFVLAGGVLTGKYGTDPNAGRAAGQLADRRYRAAAEAAGQLAQLARELDTTPAALAIAFALHNPNIATALFGATSPEQLRQNAAGLELATRLDDEQWNRLLAIGAG